MSLAQRCRRRSTPSRRGVDVAGESPRLQGWLAHQDTMLVRSRITHKAATPCSRTHLRANLAQTLSKVC